MPLFTYRATNDDNKEVRGSIESPDEENARKALEDLHLEILEIAEASRSAPVSVPATTEPSMPAFAFEGTDSTGTVRRGSVQASDKYAAFKKLRDDQKLLLTMLSPVGILPQYKDPELDQWQRGARTTTAPQRPTIGFTDVADVSKSQRAASPALRTSADSPYHPLAATLRLYAGWLLAWYGLFVAIGYYSVQRTLPWDIPFVQAFYLSPLILSFIVAIFLLLMLSALHKAMRGGALSGIAFTVLGIALFVGVRILA